LFIWDIRFVSNNITQYLTGSSNCSTSALKSSPSEAKYWRAFSSISKELSVPPLLSGSKTIEAKAVPFKCLFKARIRPPLGIIGVDCTKLDFVSVGLVVVWLVAEEDDWMVEVCFSWRRIG
jgi:hypothetical protein